MNKTIENSFDLEQAILACWNITSDLKTLYSAVMDREMSKDDIANILLGLEGLYELKFAEAFALFEKVHHDLCVLNKAVEVEKRPSEISHDVV